VPLAAEVLSRIHEEECAALAVLEVVQLEVTALREEGDALTGELDLTRREVGATP
jgi:FtsZ-binding cell division protein ZapB